MSVIQTKDLLREIRRGNCNTVRTIIDKHGLSYAKDWSGGYVPLREAVKSKRSKIAKMLLRRGAEINPRTKRLGYTPLHHAINNNDTEMVEILLKKGANVNTKGGPGTTPLHSAVSVGNVKIVKSLLNANTWVETKDRSGVTAIQSAISQDAAKIVRVLLEKGAVIAPKSSYGVSALHLAAKSGEELIIRNLLNGGADINSRSFSSFRPHYTPLHHASANGHEDIVKLLLSRGANINATTGEKYTPLHVATKNRRGKIVKLLLGCQGTKIDACDQNGKTILHIALENHDLAIIEIILEFWPKVDNMNRRKIIKNAVCMLWPNDEIFRNVLAIFRKHGFTVHSTDARDSKFLHFTVDKGCLEILEDLLKYGADVNSIDPFKKGYTLLHNAVKRRHFEAAKLLINKNANVNSKDNENELPISYAIDNIDVDMVKLLLDNGTDVTGRHNLLHNALKKVSKEVVEMILNHYSEIDINARDTLGRTALFYAVSSHDFCNYNCYFQQNIAISCYFVKLLLSRGAEVNVQDNRGISPLYLAVKSEQLKIIEILLQHNADTNSVTTYNKTTPLHCSVENGNETITKMLLEKGAKIDAKRKDGKTSLHIACEHGWINIVSTLLKCGAEVDSRDNHNVTPLQIAMMSDSLGIVQILLNHFADVDTQDLDGVGPLHVAAKRGLPEIVEELLIYGSDINVMCNKGRTPLDYALSGNRGYNDWHEGRQVDRYDRLIMFGWDDDEHSDDYDSDDYDNYGRGRGHRHGRDDEYDYDYDDYDANDCNCRSPARFGEVANILETYIVKIRALNLHVNEWDSDTVDGKAELISLHDKCKYEIEMMMNGKISDTNVSLYDLLTKGINQLAMYARNESIVKTVESNDYCEIFPIYCDMIRNNFKKAQKRESLLNSSLKSLNILSQFSLPATWSLELLNNLSNKDLRSLTKAGHSNDSNKSIG